MSFRLPTTEEKADYVLNQFNRIARRYDLANDAISLGMHRLWKRTALQRLDIQPDGQYLDVCCGTGDLTLRIAEQLSQMGMVTGLDFSPQMLDMAKLRISKKENATKVNFVQGDAEKLPFPDNYFNGSIISFGLRNLTSLDKGIAEMVRVTKPGGKVINLDLGRPSNWLFTPFYYFYFRHIVPMIGQILQNDIKAYTYLPESLNTYPTPTGITQLFEAAGLKNIQYKPLAIESVALHVGTKP